MNKIKYRLNNLEYKLSNLLKFLYKKHAYEAIKNSNKISKSIEKEKKKYKFILKNFNKKESITPDFLNYFQELNSQVIKRCDVEQDHICECGNATKNMLVKNKDNRSSDKEVKYTYKEYLKLKNLIYQKSLENNCIPRLCDCKLKTQNIKNNELFNSTNLKSAKFYTVPF